MGGSIIQSNSPFLADRSESLRPCVILYHSGGLLFPFLARARDKKKGDRYKTVGYGIHDGGGGHHRDPGGGQQARKNHAVLAKHPGFYGILTTPPRPTLRAFVGHAGTVRHSNHNLTRRVLGVHLGVDCGRAGRVVIGEIKEKR